MFLPGESQGQGACWAAVYGIAQSWTRSNLAVAAAVQKRHSELILTGILKGVKIAVGSRRMFFDEAALKIIIFLYQRSKVQYLFHCLVHMTSSKKNG